MILQRLRRAGQASKADLARAAALTNTAVGKIIGDLEALGLVRAVGRTAGGRRGQPATLLGLDPSGAYGLGVRLDRARIETVLADLGGTILTQRMHDLVLPSPARTLDIVERDIKVLLGELSPSQRRRVTGIGLARPFNLGSWLAKLDLAPDVFTPWDSADFRADLEQATGIRVLEENDGTAAAIAELFHGQGRSLGDFLYVFIGPAVGGGIALGGDYLRGSSGNAGDIAVMPVRPSALTSAGGDPNGRDILIGRASLNGLIRHLRHHGVDVSGLSDLHAAMSRAPKATDEWLDDCTDALVDPLLSAAALLDVPEVIIDSDLDSATLRALIVRLEPALAAAAPEARAAPRLLAGSFGACAGALGAATLPLFIHFAVRAGAVGEVGTAEDTGGVVNDAA
jgi:predicted NBD/HSP70 family sugar kinase